MRARVLAAAVALAVASPAHPFSATGEVLFRGGGQATSAAWDDQRIVGPSANLSRREDGGWTGDLNGEAVDLDVTDDHIVGINVDVYVKRSGRKLTIRGHFFGRRLSVEYSDRSFSGRMGACSVDLRRKRAGASYEGNAGCAAGDRGLPATASASLRLAGDAASDEPPLPQFALALVAVLIGG